MDVEYADARNALRLHGVFLWVHSLHPQFGHEVWLDDDDWWKLAFIQALALPGLYCISVSVSASKTWESFKALLCTKAAPVISCSKCRVVVYLTVFAV